jgi:hypothetical protein
VFPRPTQSEDEDLTQIYGRNSSRLSSTRLFTSSSLDLEALRKKISILERSLEQVVSMIM